MEVNIAYLAGLIDADGHVGIHKVDKGRFAPVLSFVNTDEELMKFVGSYLFGSYRTKKKYSNKHATIYEYQVREAKALIHGLTLILPYLKSKRTKALYVLEYAESILDNKGKKLTPEVISYRREIKDCIDAL